MHSILWLAGKELSVRKISLIIGLVMCSLIISMFITVEWSLRAREHQVRRDIDQIGPPLIIIPGGKSITDLRRFDLGPEYFHHRTVVAPLIEELSPHLRAVDCRLSTRLPMAGTEQPVIGIDPGRVVSPHEALRQLKENEAALGKEMADRRGIKRDDAIDIAGSVFTVKTILPSAADATDMAIFVPITELRQMADMSGGINEIRIYPKSDRHLDLIRKKLDRYGNALRPVFIDRGEVAEYKVSNSLARHRHAIYLVLGMILSFSMMVWTYLDAKERRVELATIAAVGASAKTLVGLLSARSAIVGALGALIGAMLSIGIKSFMDGGLPGNLLDLSGLMATAIFGAAVFSVAGTIPVAMNLSTGDHVTLLQN